MNPPGLHRLAKAGFAALEAGAWFEAHERFEDGWRLATSPDEKSALKGLAQLAAALVKAERAEPVGHAKLWAKSRPRLLDAATAGVELGEVSLCRLVDALPDAPPGSAWRPWIPWP